MATIADDAHPRDKRCGVVGIGASAGGLDAFGRLLDALPVNTGMAFVLIQHLDPSHESMLGHLLSIRTKMPVMEAVAAMKVEPDHVYICPPGSYLSMDAGAFRLTSPKASLRVRLPIDFFFQSLAVECGADAMAVILSGYGEDGSIGIAAVAARGGFIIVQEPKDAESDAMPCSAMATGLADVVLPVADIANVIRARGAHGAGPVGDKLAAATGDLKAIIDLLGRETAHEFSNYKTGTLQRQIERRMATSGASDAAAYLARLHNDRDELETLATDMFINVTGFFRDPDSFRLVGDEILADLKRDKSMAKDFRIWSAGCSTGEEAYSLAILRLEAMASSGARGRLQVFASDIDAAAVQKARAGLYPASIAEDVSPERLERFFFKEDGGFRVSPELRGAVVFAVHDLLADPPFLHMDLIACRNLIIYLKGDAQRAVLQQLDFALNDGGILLLGGSETVGMMKDRFKTIDGKQRLYRHEGAIRGGALARTGPALKRAGDPSILEARGRPSMRTDLGESARAFILATLAPAAVVINDRRQLLYASGSTDRFLRLPEGEQDADILAMARGALRGGMRTAITLAIAERRLVTNTVALTAQGRTMTVEVSVQPMLHDGVYFYLLSFVEENERAAAEFAVSDSATGTLDQDVGQAELEANRRELDAALRDIDVLESEREAATKVAMSVAEEYQATNEELVTSREELQSLNEELTVLNGQLQGSLERQRGLANDLQNILQSADLATLFLDEELCIRFFTRESRSIVCVRDGDVGRPLGDLTLLVDDPALLDDAAAVLATGRLIEREIEGQAERCFMRRILPYASNGTADCGVVLTFSDISGLKAAGRVAQEARAYADAVIDTTPLPMVVLDEDMRAVSANRAFHQAYAEGSGGRHDHFEAPNDRLSQLPILRLLLGKLKTITVPVENHELALDTSPLGPRNLLLSANRIHDGPMGNEKILVLIDDVTERTRIKEEVGRAKADADRANANKSRFLAAASHDLRQPLQTLSLLHGLLAAAATELPIRKLVDQVDETLTAMTDMLDSLLDIDQLEAGTVRARPIDLKIDDLLSQLGKEFTVQADAGCLRLRILRSRYGVHSDPRLLGQMLRNLLANALKFTRSGGVLVGCRYAGRWVRIEVWDTGPGIPEEDLGIVFEEFRQLGNPARERGKGQGLGLSIVQRLGGLLDHAVGVRSRIGKGSIFSVTVPISKAELPTNECGPDKPIARPNSLRTNDGSTAVLIVEDDEHVRDLLRLLLEGEGLEVTTAGDGVEAIHIARSVAIGPALMITDLNLPNGPNGLEVVAKLRAALGHCIPAIVLTGDVSTTTTKAIDDAGCVHLAKPVSAHALLKVVHRMRPMAAEVPATLKQKRRSQSFHESPTVFVVDDDPDIRAAMHQFLNTQELSVATFQSGASFLDRYRRGAPGCLLVDARMPDMSGIELLRIFRGRGHTLRAIMMTGFGDVSTAVAAMKAGASDFIEKPIGNEDLLACIDRAFAADRDGAIHAMANEDAARTVANLTSRQRDVLDLVLDGHPSKVIAFKLGISQRTVDNHRSAIMKKTNSKSIPMLIRAVWSVL